MMPPEGQLIGRAGRPWRIGRLLGSGACGSVHELVPPPGSKSSPRAYAIKVAPLPKPKAKAAGGKKRKKTAEERNADLIQHEHVTLRNAGEDLRGRVVPEIPFMGDPPAYGRTANDKFTFLVMERMAAPLSEVVPMLLESHGKARGMKRIPMGDVVVAVLDCIHAMHEKGNLFIDVKPENFMLSAPASSGKKALNGLGRRVRLIDFGLVERYGDMSCSKHRENEHPDAPLVGTPVYASLNVMSGHTCSRRDDLEALGYVVSELILMLACSGGGGAIGKRKKKDDGTLPWSRASSDVELYHIKSQEMDEGQRSKSKLFAGLKAAGADRAMSGYFTAVRGLAYSEKPDYDALRCHLKKVIVTVEGDGRCLGAKGVSSASPKKVAPRRKSARRSDRDESDCESVEAVDENVENGKSSGKKQKVSVGRDKVARSARMNTKTVKTCEMGTQTDEVEVIEIGSGDDEDAEAMEWEATASDEVIEAAANDGDGRGIVKLVVIGGPHEGEEVSLGGDWPEAVMLGRNPGSRVVKNTTAIALPEDTHASGAHAKFTVNPKKSVLSVRVSDLSSANGTYVNGSVLPKGKSKQAFIGDKVRIGESVLQIRKVN